MSTTTRSNAGQASTSSTTRRTADHASTPSRLVITVVFAALMLFIAAEPYLFEASVGMQLFQGAIMFWLWLLFMFGTPRR